MIAVGTAIHGFTAVSSVHVPETDSTLVKFVHDASGLTVLKHYLQDASYTESSATIAFATFAEDNKGLPHITEHSVFCGSQAYPHKDPFNEISKASLRTYNNACTMQTHTCYELASRCEQDYFNVLAIYLDAVFRPLLLEDPHIYAQEGWHLHLESRDGALTESGIVLSEMKSVYASPSSILLYNLQHSLYGDTVMGFETGGHPDAITTGAPEEMNTFYRRFYHFGNCVVSLYGNASIERELRMLADPYLKDFGSDNGTASGQQRRQRFPTPTPLLCTFKDGVPRQVRFVEYGVHEDTRTLDRDGVIGRSYYLFDLKGATPLLILSVRLLDYILFDQSSSPVPEHLQSFSYCKSCYSVLDYGSLQCSLFLVLVGCKHTEEDYLAVMNAYESVLLSLLAVDQTSQYYRFLSPEAVEAALNRLEFELRECPANYGLLVNELTIKASLAGCPSAMLLQYEEPLQELRNMITAGTITTYMRELIGKYLTNLNPNQADVVLVPVPGKIEVQEAERQKELARMKNGMSPEQLDELVATTEALERRAIDPVTKEVQDTIPQLQLQDARHISRDLLKLQSFLHYDVRDHAHSIPILYCHTGDQGKGITYLNVFIDVTELCDIENVHLLSILANVVLGEVSTTTYTTVESLHRAVDYYVGDLSVSLGAADLPPWSATRHTLKEKPQRCMPARVYIKIEASCKEGDIEPVLQLIFNEILEGSGSGLKQPRVLLRLLHDFWASLRERIISESPHLTASRRAKLICGHLRSFVSELAMGPSMYQWLSSFLQETLADRDENEDGAEDGAEEEICCSGNSFEGDDSDDAFLDDDVKRQELCLLGERLATLLTSMCSRPELFFVAVGQRMPDLAPYMTKTTLTADEWTDIRRIMRKNPFNKILARTVGAQYKYQSVKLSSWTKKHLCSPLAEQFDRLLLWRSHDSQGSYLDTDIADYTSIFSSLAIPSDVASVARAHVPVESENMSLSRSYLDPVTTAKYLAHHIIENVYLWDNVRVRNGAYGCSLNLELNGVLTVASYDDPRAVDTIYVYNNLKEAGSELYGSLEERVMNGYKIGCLSANQVGISPKELFNEAVYHFLNNTSVRQHYREIREILGTTPETLQAAHKYFSNLSSAPTVIVGPLSACKEALEKGLIEAFSTIE